MYYSCPIYSKLQLINGRMYLFIYVDQSEKQSIRNCSFRTWRCAIINIPLLLKSQHTEKYILRRAQSFMVAVQLGGNKCVHILGAAGGERRKWDSSVQLYRDETFPRRFHEYLAFVLASSRFFFYYFFWPLY